MTPDSERAFLKESKYKAYSLIGLTFWGAMCLRKNNSEAGACKGMT